jgi:predicted metal-dependent peptidase
MREQETPGLNTAAVDEHGNLYWDPAFVMEIGEGQTAYLVAHEAFHLVLDHPARAREIIGTTPTETQKLVCNIAADLAIEQMLAMMRHLRPDGAVYLGCVLPELGNMTLDFPENRSMREYYRLIMERLRPQANNNREESDDGQQQDDGGSEDGDSGESDGDEGSGHGGRPRQAGSGREGGGSGSSPPPSGDLGSASGDGEGAAAGGAGSSGDGKGRAGRPGAGGSCGDGQPRPYEVENDGSWDAYGSDMAAQQAEEQMAEYEASHGIGSVPGALKEILKAKLHPQPDPFDQLRSAVCSSVASPVGGRDYSHRRRSRKQPPGDKDPLLHGRITVQPHAVVIVDTSGSMGSRETKEQALTVIAQGLRKLTRVKVMCADVGIRSSQQLASLNRFEWTGGGGTDMARALENVDKLQRPDSIVIVTDGITRWPSRALRARVVVAFTGDERSPAWGKIPQRYRKVRLPRKDGR